MPAAVFHDGDGLVSLSTCKPQINPSFNKLSRSWCVIAAIEKLLTWHGTGASWLDKVN